MILIVFLEFYPTLIISPFQGLFIEIGFLTQGFALGYRIMPFQGVCGG